MRSEKGEFRGVLLLLAGFCAAALVTVILCLSFDSRVPDTVARSLTEAETAKIIGCNSPLIDYVYLSPCADFPRGNTVKKLAIYHMGENLTLETVGAYFAQSDRRSSANYAIDSQGRVGLYVEESNRAWSSISRENDDQAVTIEVANDEIGGDWHVSDEAFEKLIELCVDICRRNGIQELSYTGDETGSLTLCSSFSDNTELYLTSRMEELAETVNGRLAEE